jgi:hypothetical protein
MAEGFLCIQAMSSLITLISLIALAATEPGYIQNGMVFLKIKTMIHPSFMEESWFFF